MSSPFRLSPFTQFEYAPTSAEGWQTKDETKDLFCQEFGCFDAVDDSVSDYWTFREPQGSFPPQPMSEESRKSAPTPGEFDPAMMQFTDSCGAVFLSSPPAGRLFSGTPSLQLTEEQPLHLQTPFPQVNQEMFSPSQCSSQQDDMMDFPGLLDMPSPILGWTQSFSTPSSPQSTLVMEPEPTVARPLFSSETRQERIQQQQQPAKRKPGRPKGSVTRVGPPKPSHRPARLLVEGKNFKAVCPEYRSWLIEHRRRRRESYKQGAHSTNFRYESRAKQSSRMARIGGRFVSKAKAAALGLGAGEKLSTKGVDPVARTPF